MTNAIVNKICPDDLNNWLYTDGMNELVARSHIVSQSYHFLSLTDEDGDPSDKAREAFHDMSNFQSLLSVITLVRSQISLIDN